MSCGPSGNCELLLTLWITCWNQFAIETNAGKTNQSSSVEASIQSLHSIRECAIIIITIVVC